MENITVKDIVEFTDGVLMCGDENTPVKDICTNSKEIKEGDLFVPIIGEKVDAHRFIESALETGAATLGTSVKDTIKIVDGFNNIENTPLRSQLRAVQTPQVFEKDLYKFALENAGDDAVNFTDDCPLIENMGGEVRVVKGSEENIKLTTPIDIIIAESILKERNRYENR